MNNLHLKNFQSHSDSYLEFLPVGVNVIGSDVSNVGKSSIVRAARILVENKMRAATRKRGAKTVTIQSGEVQRIRSASKNMYKVGDEVYKAMGTSVPDPVAEELNLTEINFRKQHQPYFLIDDSPGQVAKTLNEVADLSLIDKTIAHLKSEVRTTKSVLEETHEKKEETDKKLESLAWYEDAEKLLAQIEEVEQLREKVLRNLASYNEVYSRVSRLKEKVDAYPEIEIDPIQSVMQDIRSLDQIPSFQSLATSIRKRQEDLAEVPEIRIDRIDDLFERSRKFRHVDSFKELSKGIQELEQELREVPEVNTSELEGKINCIKQTRAQLQTLTETRSALASVTVPEGPSFELAYSQLEAIKETTDMVDVYQKKRLKLLDCRGNYIETRDAVVDLETELELARDEFDNTLEDVGECPLCGGAV